MKKTDLRYVEKPDPKRPQLWMGYFVKTPSNAEERFRILHPSGITEWTSAWNIECDLDWGILPCWQGRFINKSFNARVKLMKLYDRRSGRKTMFLGNL